MTKAESKAAAVLGRKGGQSKSEAKAQASRDNGKLGKRRCAHCGHTREQHREWREGLSREICLEEDCNCMQFEESKHEKHPR
jgi:hypothetical protein